MGFEFFKGGGRGFRPRASIRKQGQIGLNQGAVRRFSLKEWQFVVLGYDRDTKRIGLKRAIDESTPGAQKLVIKSDSVSIAARSFLEYFDIPYQHKTRQFDVEMDESEQMLVINLLDNEDFSTNHQSTD